MLTSSPALASQTHSIFNDSIVLRSNHYKHSPAPCQFGLALFPSHKWNDSTVSRKSSTWPESLPMLASTANNQSRPTLFLFCRTADHSSNSRELVVLAGIALFRTGKA